MSPSGGKTTAPSPKIRWLIFASLALLALAIRLPQLGSRPLHTDEAVNAYLTGDLLAGGTYHYDPRDRHGPALYAVAVPIARLLGARDLATLTEFELRLPSVLLGSLIILLFGAGVEMFGFTACLVAAILFAVDPLPVYYSRYFIHETLFVTTTLGLLLSGWRFLHCHSVWAGILAGACAALMLACKETAPIHFFALGVALVYTWFLMPREKLPPLKSLAPALAAGLFLAVLLFTWFGRNWAVFSSLPQTVSNFTARAAGEGHAKPIGYYFHLIDPMFVLSIVALAGAYAAICETFSHVNKPHLLLIIYGIVVFLAYSAIPYKTPWLALNLWLPLALACGLGVAAFWKQVHTPSGRWLVGFAGVFLLALLALQTKVLCFDRPADDQNPFAYAHTSEDLLNLPPRLDQLVALNHLAQPRIDVIAADPWPLPWYLRKFSQVGYWQPGQPAAPADFLITTGSLSDALGSQLQKYRPEYFGARPGVLLVLWIPPNLKAAP